MFKRRMVEGNAGFRQLKCNDRHKSSTSSGVTLLAMRSKRPNLICCSETQLFIQKPLLFILRSFYLFKKKENLFFFFNTNSSLWCFHTVDSSLYCKEQTKLRLCSDIAWKSHPLFSENCINSKAVQGIIQLANNVGCSRKEHITKYTLLLPPGYYFLYGLEPAWRQELYLSLWQILIWCRIMKKFSVKWSPQLFNLLIHPIKLNLIANFLI